MATKTTANGAAESPKTTTASKSTSSIANSLTVKERPIEDRIRRVEQLHHLVEQRTSLMGTRQQLDTFKLEDNENPLTLLLEDGAGGRFKTLQPEIVKEVYHLISKVVDDRIMQVNELIVLK